jgi:hypothetical protein
VTDESNGRTKPSEVVTATDIPCHISYEAIKPTASVEAASQVVQSIKLFVDPAVVIPEGSKITVTQNGVTRDYEQSGTAAVYSKHKEIPVELFRGWA